MDAVSLGEVVGGIIGGLAIVGIMTRLFNYINKFYIKNKKISVLISAIITLIVLIIVGNSQYKAANEIVFYYGLPVILWLVYDLRKISKSE